MAEANRNAKLLKVAEEQLSLQEVALAAKDSALFAKDSTILSQESIVVLKEEIIEGKDHEIGELRLENTKINRKLKWAKFQIAGTTVALGGTLIFLLIK